MCLLTKKESVMKINKVSLLIMKETLEVQRAKCNTKKKRKSVIERDSCIIIHKENV